MTAILIVEDEAPLRQSIALSLRREGFDVAQAQSHVEALERLARDCFDVILLDLRLGDGDGLTLLRDLKTQAPEAEKIVMTAYASIEAAIEAVRLGAYDFLQKPFVPERLTTSIRRALEHRRLRAEIHRRTGGLAADPTSSLVGVSTAMQELRTRVQQAAASRVVLVTGETGTGKELVARAVHASGDPEAPFVIVNCGTLPESLVESELFGHVRGAFSGATRNRVGLLAQAEGGTAFLDEVGEVPLALQPRLLRFLESGEVRAVGADHTSHVSCRVVAATNRDPEREVREGRMRQDLLYRLDVFRIVLSPLRDRLEDLRPLCDHLLDRIARRLRRARPQLGPGALDALRSYSWPGNVRELEHALERAMLVMTGTALPADLLIRGSDAPEPKAAADAPAATASVLALAEVERQHILAVLDQFGGDRHRAANALGISRSTLRRKLIEYFRDPAVLDDGGADGCT